MGSISGWYLEEAAKDVEEDSFTCTGVFQISAPGVLHCVLNELHEDNFPRRQGSWTNLAPFDFLARAEHYGTYLTPLRFDAQVFGPTTKI